MSRERLTLDGTLTPESLAKIKAGQGSAHDRAREATHKAGLVLTGSEQERLSNATPYRPGILYANPMRISKRWPYAVMRIKRILEGAHRTSNIEHAVKESEYSALAKEYMETWMFYMTRNRPAPPRGRRDHNPYRNLSDTDAARMFVRRVEDVCDKSCRQLGGWWVK